MLESIYPQVTAYWASENSLEKNPMHVKSVQKLSTGSQNSLYIGEFTLERSFTNVVNVRKPSAAIALENTQERNTTDAVIVRKFSHRWHNSLYIGELVQERNAMNAVNVKNISAISQHSSYSREPIQEETTTLYVCSEWGEAFICKPDLKRQQGTHEETDPMKSVNVGNSLMSSHTSEDILIKENVMQPKISYRREITWIYRRRKHSRRLLQHEIMDI